MRISLFTGIPVIIGALLQNQVLALSPDAPPSVNFDLSGWALDIPVDDDEDGVYDQINEITLNDGYTRPGRFFTAKDGGMVFRAYVSDLRTSKRTKYTRSNLREMLRRGQLDIVIENVDGTPTKNNWVLSTAPESAKRAAGGIDGELYAELAVNHATTTGHPSKVGKMTIAQMHSLVHEPIILMYRKLPANSRGSIYAVHEEANGNDHFYEIVGSSASTAENPENGIALNEPFSYRITVTGNEIKVVIATEQAILGKVSIDIKNSGYAVANDAYHFTVGVVNKNNTGETEDYSQATFYKLETKHMTHSMENKQ